MAKGPNIAWGLLKLAWKSCYKNDPGIAPEALTRQDPTPNFSSLGSGKEGDPHL